MILPLLLLASWAALAVDWSTVVKPAAKQVVRIEMLREGQSGPGVCSGVVIDKVRGYVLTCAHCVSKPQAEGLSITVNQRHADVVRTNDLLDLAVLRTTLRGEEAIALADHTPAMGTDIAIVGYAFGDKKLIAQFGRVAQALNDETNLIFVNADVISGDSGGALIDEQGRLVGLNSRVYYNGPMHLAGSVPIESVREFAEGFLPKATP